MRRVLRMAMWRRPPGFEPPAELFEFDPADWPGSDVFTDWPTENPAWEAAFKRWNAARRAWVAKHPNSRLGNRLDLLRGERLARFGDLEARLSGHVGVVRLRRGVVISDES
jgi:hypothetical protein